MNQTDLLERQDDLAELEQALDRAKTGVGGIALVFGEAGIGKTSLVEHFAQRQGDTVRVLRGYCDPLLTPSALGPLHDVAGLLGGELPRLLEDETRTTAIFACVLDTLANLSDPTVFVIEDLHWADGATLDMVKYLARRLGPARILLIVTFRDDEVQVHEPLRLLLGNLATERGVQRIGLARLSRDAVATLADGRIADVDSLFDKTSGNPFFVSEVIANPETNLPQSVRDAVLGRAARLSNAGNAVLDRAAIIGARIGYSLLEEFSDDVQVGLAECLGLGILQDTGAGIAFRHELARNAVLERIEPLRRRALYREVLAAAVKQRYAERGRFARLAHYAEGAFSADDVIAYGARAGQAAAAAGSHREAAAHYASVLRFSEDRPPVERARFLTAFASECAVIDRLAESVDAYRDAIELWSAAGERLRHGETLAALAWPLVRNGENAAADAAVEEAVALLEPLGPSLELAEAYRVKAHLHMLDRDREQAARIGQKAIALASKFGDDRILAASEMVVGAAMLVFDDAEGRPRLDRSLEIARAGGLDEIVALVHANAGSAYGEQYHFVEAEEELLEGLSFTKENDLDHSGHYLSAWLAMTYLFQGRWDKAAEISAELIAQPNVSTVSRIMALVALGRVRVRRGDPGASDVLDEALALSLGTGTLQRLAPVHAARAERAWFRRRPRSGGGRGKRWLRDGGSAKTCVAHGRVPVLAAAGRRDASQSPLGCPTLCASDRRKLAGGSRSLAAARLSLRGSEVTRPRR